MYTALRWNDVHEHLMYLIGTLIDYVIFHANQQQTRPHITELTILSVDTEFVMNKSSDRLSLPSNRRIYLTAQRRLQRTGRAYCLFHSGFSLGILFGPENGSDMFPRNSVEFHSTTRRQIPATALLNNLFTCCFVLLWNLIFCPMEETKIDRIWG